LSIYYQDQWVTLYHGDCLEITDWLSADVLVTDPPYGIRWKINAYNPGQSHNGIGGDHDTTCRDEALQKWGNKSAIVFGAWKAQLPQAKQTLIWRKPVDSGVIGSTTGYRTDVELIFLAGQWPRRPASRSSVVETNRGAQSYLKRSGHPHAKPVDLLVYLIEWTTGTVADPFAGIGSTLIAAKRLSRRAIGVELEERYCELAAKRLSQDAFDFSEELNGVGAID
jgi:DNA modification methylase